MATRGHFLALRYLRFPLSSRHSFSIGGTAAHQEYHFTAPQYIESALARANLSSYFLMRQSGAEWPQPPQSLHLLSSPRSPCETCYWNVFQTSDSVVLGFVTCRHASSSRSSSGQRTPLRWLLITPNLNIIIALNQIFASFDQSLGHEGPEIIIITGAAIKRTSI